MSATIRFNRQQLADAMKQGQLVSDGPDGAVSTGVRMSIAKGAASLVWTDMSLWLTREVAASCDAITACSVPADLLARSASGMIGEELTIRTGDGKAQVSCGRSRLSLPLNVADFFPMPPKIAKGEQAVVKARDLFEALDSVNYFDPDDIGSSVGAVNFRFRLSSGDVCLASYSGVRLAADVITNTGADLPEFNLPLKAADVLTRLCKRAPDADCSISATDKLAQFEVSDWVLTAALHHQGFIDYAKLIDEQSEHPVMFDPRELANACSRLSVASDKYSKVVRLDLTTDKITMALTNPKIGEASEEVPAAYDGPPQTLGYNVAFLREALRHVPGDDAEMHIGREVKRARITPRDRMGATHIIGPMAI